jgi:hypothetical protein
MLDVLVLLSTAQEPTEPVGWVSFETGSWVRTRTQQVSAKGRVRHEWSTRKTWKGMDNGAAVFEIAYEPGEGEAPKVRIDKQPPSAWAESPSPWTPEKEETIELGGRSVKCRVLVQEKGEEVARVWLGSLDSSVPNWDVKFESRSKNLNRAWRVVAWDEAVRVGEREYRCAREEMDHDSVNSASCFKAELWKCPDVPGHLVKAVTRFRAGDKQIDEVVEFQAIRKPRK